jgi:hypothetical protein
MVLYVRTVRQVCPDMYFHVISYVALRPDDISDTSER